MDNNKKINSTLFLSLSVFTLIVGIAILFMTALSHINPNLTFKSLWNKEPLMNLVEAVIPVLKR